MSSVTLLFLAAQFLFGSADPPALAGAMERAIAQGKLIQPEGESAWDLYQRLLQSSSDAREKERARTTLAAALENAGQQPILAYMQLREPSSGQPLTSLEAGFSAEEFRYAARLLERALELRPRDGKLRSKQRFCEGRAFMAEGHYPEALPVLQQSIALDPTPAYSYNALGVVHLNRRMWPDAVHYLRLAAERAPKWVYPHHNLGLAYLELNRFEDTEREWVLTSVLAPQRAFPHINLGVLYLKMGRRRDAERELRHAAQLDPVGATTNHNLGLVYQLQNQLAQAEAYYRKAIAADPRNVSSRVNLAALYRDRGDTGRAERELRQALDIDPHNSTASQALAELLKDTRKTGKP